MARLSWAPQALEDVEAIRTFIARDAPRTTQIFVQRIFDSVERLERFPLAGAIVPEVGLAIFREVWIKRYRIIYRVITPDLVEIVTVHHSARPLDPKILPRG